MSMRMLSLFARPQLEEYARASLERRWEIEQEIWSIYGQEYAVLVLDMSGFSLLTQRHGIIFYLSMVRRMQQVVAPLTARHGGRIVKFEADNAFAVFKTVQSAVETAKEIHAFFAAENHPEKIRVSIGIDYGKVLMVDDIDVFGNPVNRASKLGEDIAEAGETLITSEAFALIPENANITGKHTPMTISGIAIEVISL